MEPTESTADEPALLEDAPLDLPNGTETATFGAGCFWGPDARFGALEGVARTRVGYAGGADPDPTYFALGDHTEVVRVAYDPEIVSYEELLETFRASHDWHTDAPKRQYRSVVLAHDDDQYERARRERDAIAERTGRSPATDVELLEAFHAAEPFHQKYELRSRPIVGDELETLYGEAFVDSTVVARLNGFAAGHVDRSRYDALLAALDLPTPILAELRRWR
ncbi:peptide-methionine (S)-S-oxide reductase [Natronococcus jeotgali]|uniref:peptide-methionine (S)-S-oxide reductase n=1 Tax=Natronococcus jeotgali DSM 18795 TaxID=1227498 RepID=L9WMF1_9EURY|nr:peptide-methionine (S)-S-oxide reductase [Natronococcus jeotgali]ELY50562.1 peptide methionine sulfoxide reductase [Natronococcus jeotgali DSM 18795]